MGLTEITGKQVRDGSITRDDINTGTSGLAVIRKLLATAGITIQSYTGADLGTGDVIIAADLTFLNTKYFAKTDSVAQNTVLAGPTSGSGPATFRTLTAGDVPTPNLQQVTDTGGATTANVMLAGQVTIGSTASPKTFAADATFLPGYTPNTEVITGSSSGVAYSEAVVIRHNSSGGAAAVQRELGIIFKMNADTSAGESQKMGAIMMRSLNAFSNNPDMLFFTRNVERMRIADNGNVGIGTTSPATKLDVGGSVRIAPESTLNATGSVLTLNETTGIVGKRTAAELRTDIGVGDGTLTLATSGIATGSGSFTANQTANATFTVNVPGTDLSEGTPFGQIVSSTGTNVRLSSLFLKLVTDLNSHYTGSGLGFIPYYNASSTPNAPTTGAGGGFTFIRNNESYAGRLDVWVPNSGSSDNMLYLRTRNAAGSAMNPWSVVADRTWVNAQLGNGTLTLATSGIASGSQTFTANQATNATFTVNVPGTNLGSAAAYGSLTSSTGTGATLTSISRTTISDGNEIPSTFGIIGTFNSTGSTNYPTVSGGGIKFVRAADTAAGSFHLWTDASAADDIWYKTGAGASTWNTWKRIASKEWVNSQGFLNAETDPVWLADKPSYMKNSPEGAAWDSVMISGKGQLVSSSTDNPVGSAAVYHGAFFPHSTTTTYGTALAFRNGTAYIRSIEAGTIGPWKQLVTPEINTLQATTDSGNSTTNNIELTGGAGGRSASATSSGFNIQEPSSGAGYSGGLHLRDSTGAAIKGGFGFYGTGSYAYIGYGGATPWTTNRTVAISADGVLITPEGGSTAPPSGVPLQVLANAASGVTARFDRVTEDAMSAGVRISSESTSGTKKFADFVVNAQSNIAGIGYGTTAGELPIGQTGTTNLGMWVNITNDLFSGRHLTVGNTLYIPSLGTTTAKMLTVGADGVVSSQDIPAASGTVTSVAASVSGALSVSGSPVTSSGTLAFTWAGTTGQYVRGDGSLATFPTIPTYTGSTSITLSGSSFQRAALTGDVTAAANSNATTIAENVVTYAKMQDVAGVSVIGRSANTTGDPDAITAAADGQVLRRNGASLEFGTVSTAGIADDAVTFDKVQDIDNGKILGRWSPGTGNIQQLGVGEGLAISSTNLAAKVSHRSGSFSTTLGTIGAFGSATFNITVPGAALGMPAEVFPDPAAAAIMPLVLKAAVTAANTLTVYAFNASNNAISVPTALYKGVAWILE